MTADDWREFLEWMFWALLIGCIIAASLWHLLVDP